MRARAFGVAFPVTALPVGYHPVGFDLNTDLPAAEGFTVVSTLVEMAEMLPPPRFILLVVPAGEPVDLVMIHFFHTSEKGTWLSMRATPTSKTANTGIKCSQGKDSNSLAWGFPAEKKGRCGDLA